MDVSNYLAARPCYDHMTPLNQHYFKSLLCVYVSETGARNRYER